ncbi:MULTISPECIES: hypothetical protein [unclassified Sphingomonas]|uniref:hypothetical protein n=1 Tax=unclassified Sphingomonas TaxID=196159 RepID=UPI0006F5768D|nr:MULTISPECIES: hypothetical protein [unclassified Sphingomonas]KQM57231.1 hypothetical protein ASE65_12960 [Sphingomonas sp. Leaf16]KQN10406.1 hypothetical protein ASE81_13005 [Sphingomonas sp. Leaf29]KQN18206.1 hypothetical protein ASE83_12940 [Sphingomonas sp. Leaf32]
MKPSLSRAIMVLATACMGEDRRDWAAAMTAEFDAAADDGRAMSFAAGCLLAAGRELLVSAHGRFLMTSYAVALGIMLPVAALQIACAVFGLTYLYPGHHGLSGALIEGMSTVWMRGFYQSAGPMLALLQLAIGIAHLRGAWLLLERDWDAATRWSVRTLATSTTLILFMGALFIDVRQAAIMGVVVAVEFAILLTLSSRHADLAVPMTGELPG